jgi:hypothetical protein
MIKGGTLSLVTVVCLCLCAGGRGFVYAATPLKPLQSQAFSNQLPGGPPKDSIIAHAAGGEGADSVRDLYQPPAAVAAAPAAPAAPSAGVAAAAQSSAADSIAAASAERKAHRKRGHLSAFFSPISMAT